MKYPTLTLLHSTKQTKSTLPIFPKAHHLSLSQKNFENFYFINGVVMNHNYYLCAMGVRVVGGRVLGKINARKLKQVWRSY